MSRRVGPGSCGGSDIYFARSNPKHGWGEPARFACAAEGGPNTPLDEMGPSYVTVGGPSLYYSSGPDIYVSERHATGAPAPASPWSS